MAYSNNPNLPKARALALRLLIEEALPAQVVANKCGVNRSTIYRWKKKWIKLNENVQLENFNRPTRDLGSKFRFAALKWRISTLSSRPNAITKAVVEMVLGLRQKLKRCAEVIWFHLNQDYDIRISLSSVRRILKRHHYISGRKKRIRSDNPRRPHVTKPGELVETDTIHYICPLTKRRRYVYTVIDIYTRMTYAEIHEHIRPGIAANAICRAEARFGFSFTMVQSDNGPEFSHYFEQTLAKRGILTRHTRLGRPNDNAHIERYNRIIQEECLGNTITYKIANKQLQIKINNYLDYYNAKRVHLSLQYRTPLQMLQSS